MTLKFSIRKKKIVSHRNIANWPFLIVQG